jgi:MFS family permease
MTYVHLKILFCRIALTCPPSIIFRAFQGLGASGIQAISIIIIPDLIPVPKLLKYSSFVSMALMLGLIVGLLLGGLISDEGSWRWVFYIKYVGHDSILEL